MKKTVVITGAGSGLGRGLCLHLAQLDWRVLALDKNLDAAEQTVAMLPVPAKGQVYEIDVSSPDEVDRFATQMAEQRPDVLINNAGCQHVAPLEAFPSEKWASLIAVIYVWKVLEKAYFGKHATPMCARRCKETCSKI